jgi:CDP-glycerol glycerophosphotransferase (TagB/SpsB family)
VQQNATTLCAKRSCCEMSGEWKGGKGSRYRNVDQKKFNDNWDTIFKSKKKSETKPEKNIVKSEKSTG